MSYLSYFSSEYFPGSVPRKAFESPFFGWFVYENLRVPVGFNTTLQAFLHHL